MIKFVLVNTSHPGNIGSAARAMKTMGLFDLSLVAPVRFPHHMATELASNAGDILQNAEVVETVEEAIAGASLVLGTSARSRTTPWPLVNPREAAAKMHEAAANSEKIAILFGSEKTGLSNEHLAKCHYHVHIPSNPDYSSLNLAMAVQVIAYELKMAKELLDNTPSLGDKPAPMASSEQMDAFFVHLQEILEKLTFLQVKKPKRVMLRMRRLFLKARPDHQDIQILRGILKLMGRTIDRTETVRHEEPLP